MKKILMIIAKNEFRDEEYLVPKEYFEKAGIFVETASTGKGTCLGKLGASVEAQMSIDDVDTSDYDAVVFVGGYGSTVYFNNATAHRIAKDFYNSGKVTSAICIAPMILVNSGILNGKKATVYQSEAENMKNSGVNYTNAPVEVDGNIITANGPDAAASFAESIISVLKSKV
ncbi:MAG: DJ-1/PfpI family protein [Armatimonadota bacterium]